MSGLECANNTTQNYHMVEPPLSDLAHWQANCWGLLLFNLILGMYVILSNSVVLSYYGNKIKELVPFMFVSIASVDVMTGVNALLQSLFFGLILVGSCRESIDYLTIFVATTAMWCIRVSCFLNTTLGIIRTINIIQPFATISRKALIISVVVYSVLFWPPIIVYQIIENEKDPIYFTPPGKEYKMKVIRSASLTGDAIVHLIFGDNHYLPVVFCVFLPFLFPSIISVVSSWIQVNALLTRKVACQSTVSGSICKQDIAITVLLLTVVFTICNSTVAVYWSLLCFDVLDVTPSNAIVLYIISVSLPFINAAISPTILISRGTALKVYLLRKLGKHPDEVKSSQLTIQTTV